MTEHDDDEGADGRCPDWSDGPEPTQATHTCDRTAGHHGPHHCPTCGSEWDG